MNNNFKTYINKIISIFNIKHIDIKARKIMINGIRLSFILLLFSIFILSIYLDYNLNFLYILGTSLFKSASMFMVAFFIDGICFNKIINEKNI